MILNKISKIKLKKNFDLQFDFNFKIKCIISTFYANNS